MLIEWIFKVELIIVQHTGDMEFIVASTAVNKFLAKGENSFYIWIDTKQKSDVWYLSHIHI